MVLPDAGGADERDDLAGPHAERGVRRAPAGPSGTRSRTSATVDAERAGGQRRRGRRSGIGAASVASTPVDAVVGDDRARQLLEQEADDPHREGEDAEQRHRLHQLAGGDRALRQPPGAEPSSTMVPRFGRGRGRARSAARSRPTREALVAQRLGGGGEPARPRGRPARASSRPARPRSSRGRPTTTSPKRACTAPAGLLDAGRVDVVEQRQQREQREAHQREDGVDHRAAGRRRRATITTTPIENGSGLMASVAPLAVGVGVGQQLAGRAGLVERRAARPGTVGDAGAPRRLHAERGHAAEVAAADHTDGPQQRHDHDGEHRAADRLTGRLRSRTPGRSARRSPARARSWHPPT